MPKSFILLPALFIGLMAAAQPEIAEWRGKDRAGIFNEPGLMTQWPEEGPNELWAVEGIGNGYGSPVVAGDEIFITGEKDSIAWLLCLSTKGELKWKSPVGKEWVKSFPGSRSAPTVVGKLIYVGTGLGDLYCLNRNDGSIVWSKNCDSDFHGLEVLHGHSEAPVVSGDKVFSTPGGEEFNVVALNRFTGDLIWKNKGFGERAAYNPSKLINHNGRKIFCTFSAYKFMGFDTETGKLLWVHEQDNVPVEDRKFGMGDTHSNAALYKNGTIYYTTGDGNGCVRLELSEGGTEITEAWRNKEFDGFMGGVVKLENFLYGTGTTRKALHSLNAETGEVVQSLNIGSGAVIAANQMLYYYNQRGELMLLSTDKGKMEKISSFRIKKGTKEHFSHPIINNGVLYQRHGDVLMAFDIRE